MWTLVFVTEQTAHHPGLNFRTMNADTPYTRTLRRALGICGSEAALASTLNVSVAALYRWIHGDTVPIEVYMRALDLVAGRRYGGPL
jgi:DNA-binding transcriptional regulator YiaG